MAVERVELTAAAESHRRKLRRERVRKTISYVLLSVIGITMVMPFLWMVSTSLKDPGAVFDFPPKWIPSETNYYLSGPEGESKVNVIVKTAVVEYVEAGIPTGEKSEVPMLMVTKSPWWSFSDRTFIRDENRVREVVVREKKVKIRMQEGPNKGKLEVFPYEMIREEKRIKINWNNYPRAWNAVPFGRAYVNSAIVAVTVTLGQVLTSSLAGYAFARLTFPGRDKLFLGYLATMMIPYAVTMIPIFILLRQIPELLNNVFNTDFWSSDRYIGRYPVGKPIGIDSYFGLIAPGFFSAYGTFMLRQFFMSIPKELEDAARIDGSSLMGIYFTIILPLCKPALATLAIFTFMASWSNFMWPLIVVSSEYLKTLPLLLSSFQGLYTTEWTLLMAGSIIVLFPVLFVFILGQKYFVEGIKLGAVKG